MKRMVAVGILAVLACALFLVPYASAAIKLTIIDTWVEGPSGEVLDEYTYVDVDEECTYNVKLGIEGTSMRPIFVKAHLTFGPNYRNRNCQDNRTKSGKVDIGETTTTISFADLSFLPLADCDEAFKEFTDGKRGWKWDKCWYKFDVESTMVEGAQTEIKHGIPIVTICEEIFKNPYVNQNETYKDLSFDYSVVVWSNKNDSVKLLVRDKNGRWSSMGSRNYTSPYSWQPLIWHGVNLSLDKFTPNFEGNLEGGYRFVGSCNESPPSGHVGPVIEEEFYDPMVSYNETVNELSFDYEVTACCRVEDNTILLEVRNFRDNSWEPKGIQSYTKPGYNQTPRWTGINLSFDHFDDHLRGKYRFTGTYGESSPTDKGHQGPIIEESFYNFNVTPPDGTINDTFTYNVTVNANISDKIVLQVRNHTSGNWTSKGTQNYTTPDKPDTLVWPNITLNEYELSPLKDARYRYVGFCNNLFPNKEGKEGPFWETCLEWNESSISVTPERDLGNTEFNYSIRMYAQRNLSVKLVVYKPTKEKWPSEEEIYNETKEYTNIYNWTTISWNIKPFIVAYKEEKCVGYAAYKFVFLRKGEYINETEISKGPYVDIAKFVNATVNPPIGTPDKTFTYCVQVYATEGGRVRIFWNDSSQNKDDISIGRCDRQNEEVSRCCNKTFEGWELGIITYRFEFTSDTGKTAPSKEYTGPLLIEEKISNFAVTPDEGNYTTCFNFTANFSSSKEGNVSVTLQVSLNDEVDDDEWTSVATEWYNNDMPGTTIPINFTVCMNENEKLKNLISGWKNNLVIYWRVKGLYQKSIEVPTTYKILCQWYNPGVSSEEGWWYEPFTFWVTLRASENGTVALQKKLDDTDADWKDVGDTHNYAAPGTLVPFKWPNVTLCAPYTVTTKYNTKYRFEFKCGKNASYYNKDDGLAGPVLFKPLNISFDKSSVNPPVGVYFNLSFFIDNPTEYNYFKDSLKSTYFNFSINTSAAYNTTINLVLVDPDGISCPKGSCNYSTSSHPNKCSWHDIKLPDGKVGDWSFTFLYNDSRYGWQTWNGSFEGFKILAVFENWDSFPNPPIYSKPCNVTIWMRGAEMNVTLEAFNINPHDVFFNQWVPIGTKHYEPSEDKISWTIDTVEVPFNKLKLNWSE